MRCVEDFDSRFYSVKFTALSFNCSNDTRRLGIDSHDFKLSSSQAIKRLLLILQDPYDPGSEFIVDFAMYQPVTGY